MKNGNLRTAVIALLCTIVFGLGGFIIGHERAQVKIAEKYSTKDELSEVRRDVRELRGDVKEILRRLPPP